MSNHDSNVGVPSIKWLAVSGFKSIARDTKIELKPLTILAGANSSGKSSFIQPLLLLKQTLEASFDPGALFIAGPNVPFTSAKQFLSSLPRGDRISNLSIGIGIRDEDLWFNFSYRPRTGLTLSDLTSKRGRDRMRLSPGKVQDEDVLEYFNLSAVKNLFMPSSHDQNERASHWYFDRTRCFLTLTQREGSGSTAREFGGRFSFWGHFENAIRAVIHLPGLRGTPARTYPATAVAQTYPGVFQQYTASVIARLQSTRRFDALAKIDQNLQHLGLASRARARRLNETEVQLQVDRLKEGTAKKQGVNIADVGLGVSQVLPILVALEIAQPGQLVFIEQPEIHLHPRAQLALARVFAQAAAKGITIVIETHSALLLLGLQTEVADKSSPLTSKDICLNWFTQSREGVTRVHSSEVDDLGAYGDWPADFGDVELLAESRYLDSLAEKE